MTEISMYWLTRLDQIHSFLNRIHLLAVLLSLIGFITLCIMFSVRKLNEQYNKLPYEGYEGYIDKDYDTADRIIKALRWPFTSCVLTALVCSLALTFIPTTKEMAAIKVIPMITTPENCEKIKGISKDILDVTAEWLKEAKKKQK